MASASESQRRRVLAGSSAIASEIIVQLLTPMQKLSLGLFRSDYMVHQGDPDTVPTIKQVEFNTIASSFGGLSSRTSDLHR